VLQKNKSQKKIRKSINYLTYFNTFTIEEIIKTKLQISISGNYLIGIVKHNGEISAFGVINRYRQWNEKSFVQINLSKNLD
jgi:hypothetical protein